MWLLHLVARGLTSRRRANASLLMSAAGIAAGVLSITVVLGIMNGLQDLLIKKLVAVDAYEYAGYLPGQRTLADAREAREQLLAIDGVREAVAFVDEFALADIGGEQSVLRVRALLAEAASRDEAFLRALLIEPSGAEYEGAAAKENAEQTAADAPQENQNPYGIFMSPDGVLLGWNFTSRYGTASGDVVSLTFAGEGAGFIPAQENVSVANIFYTASEYDANLAFISLEGYLDAVAAQQNGQQEKSTAGGAVSNMRFGLRFDGAPTRASLSRVREILSDVTSWQESNRSFYFALKTEKSLLIALAAIIFAVILLHFRFALLRRIGSRAEDIAAVRMMGGSPRQVRLWFWGEAAAAGLCGIAAGLAAGLAVVAYYPRITQILRTLAGNYDISPAPAGFITAAQGLGIILGTGLMIAAAAYTATRRIARGPVASRYES